MRYVEAVLAEALFSLVQQKWTEDDPLPYYAIEASA